MLLDIPLNLKASPFGCTTSSLMRECRQRCATLGYSREDQLRIFADAANVMALEILSSCLQTVKSEEHYHFLIEDFKNKYCYRAFNYLDKTYRQIPFLELYNYLREKDTYIKFVESVLNEITQLVDNSNNIKESKERI